MANEFKVKNGLKFPDGTVQTTASTGGSQTYPENEGIVTYSIMGGWGPSLVQPSGNIVGTTEPQTLTNKTLTKPNIGGYVENFQDWGFSSGTYTLPVDTHTLIRARLLGTSAHTLSLPSPIGRAGQSFVLLTSISNINAYIVWSGSIRWPGGTAPTIASGTYVHKFVFVADDSLWYGALAGSKYTA